MTVGAVPGDVARSPHRHWHALSAMEAVTATGSDADAGLAARCVAQEGDFFETLPADVDVCVVKHVVHNWDDTRASQLLRGCVKAVGPEGHVLVVEGLLLPGNRKDATALLDIEMLVLCGPGRERTKPEMRRLLTSSGLRLVSTHDLAGMTRLLICRPIPD